MDKSDPPRIVLVR